jgi:radical SAM superfamily enzyme YgiQ (UPF0313 family)
MRKKLLLINPVNYTRVGLTVNSSSRFPPLGLGIVAALTPDDWDIEIIDENFEKFKYRKADLVGLTTFTANANRAYKIAGIYRKKGTPTILGGIHASMRPQEATGHVDSVVVGEVESIWREVIADFAGGKMKKIYKGKWLDLTRMPQPRRDLFHPGYVFASVQTGRGCPMDCEFCSVSAFNGRRYRQRPVDEVLDELENISQKMVFFVDDNIIGYGKRAEERAIALFKGMIDRGIKKDWLCQASLNFADNEEVLKYAAKSGCRMVFLGVEAESDEALREVNKKMNLKVGVKSYNEIFRRINRHGISVLGAFIYGMDSDTVDSLRRRTDYIINSPIDVMQTTYLTPLPGTRLFDRFENKGLLLYTKLPDDWFHYDMTEVVYKPLLMSSRELSEVMTESVSRLYSRGTLFRKFIKTLFTTRSFVTAMWAFSSNINYRNVAFGGEGPGMKRKNQSQAPSLV